MKQIKFLFYALFFLMFAVTSCNNEDEVPPVEEINEAEVLVKFLEGTTSPLGKDYVATDMPSIMAASEVKTLNETGKVYIMDIRSASDFALGHIKNAKNVPVADVLTHIKGVNLASYDKVAVVCYTGQTSGFAASLLRIMGYSKVFSLKWGMCSWHNDFASKWNTAIASGNAYASQFVTTDTPKGAKGAMPKLSTGKKTGLEILEARVAAVLTEGFTPASVTGSTVFGSLSSYYIVNYWPVAQYSDAALGHIPGSMQFTPKESMKYTADLTTLPTNKTIAIYCYTGQTSSFLAAYLRLLGYDAKSVLYGTNAMIYDKMVAKGGMSVFKASEIMGYDYEK
jgi:rhodanese-related sulfurtransferase